MTAGRTSDERTQPLPLVVVLVHVVAMLGGWRWSAGVAAASGLFVGGVLAIVAVGAVFVVQVMVGHVYIGVVSGLGVVFAAVVVGRFADSTWVAVAGVAGLQVGISLVFGLLSLLVGVVPEFLVVFGAQGLVAVAAAAAAAQGRMVWVGLAVGLLGGVVVMLWELGRTGRGALVLGTVLVVVAIALFVRRAKQALVVVPVAAVVAVAVAQVYVLVPDVVNRMYPVVAG